MLRLSNTALFTGVACAFGLLTVGAPAFAGDPQSVAPVVVLGAMPDPDTVSTRVPYGDLDLTTSAGQKVLHQRVRDAAHAVCRQIDDGPGPIGFAFGCEHRAIQDAALGESAAIAKAKTQTSIMASLGP